MSNYIVVFDVSSSTKLLEDIHRSGNEPEIVKLYVDLYKYLSENIGEGEIYKFLGDGFILIFDIERSIDSILHFIIRLVYHFRDLCGHFIDFHIENEKIGRVGMTVGVDRATAFPFSLGGKQEYISRGINFASRLQGGLDGIDDENKIAISKSVYYDIKDEKLRLMFSKRQRVYKNVAEDRGIGTYEMKVEVGEQFKLLTINEEYSIIAYQRFDGMFFFKVIDKYLALQSVSPKFRDKSECLQYMIDFRDGINEDLKRKKNEPNI